MGFSVAIYGLVLYQDITGHIDPQDWWRILIFGVPATLIVFCFINLEQNGFIVHSSLIKIGDASYSIYLSHILTLSLMGRVWSSFSSDSVYDNFIILPILFFLSLAMGMMSFNIIERPLLAFSRRIA